MGTLSRETLEMIESGSAAGDDTGIFGTYTREDEASLVLYPVRWEPTTSYGGGTSEGPDIILEASRQMDLEDLCFDRPYRSGIYLDSGCNDINEWNKKAGLLVNSIRERGEGSAQEDIAAVNKLSAQVNKVVYEDTSRLTKNGKFVGVIGGDHSSPYGYIKHLAETHSQFGILHFDAHLDLRDSFEGFKHSHASIMNNVLTDFPQVTKLISIGIRDFSFMEKDFCRKHSNRVKVYSDRHCFRLKQEGFLFSKITKEILSQLPQKVYVSFDIDGLDQRFCPSTGTPVPGGLEFAEANYLIEELALSGKTIIGFDLCEVARSADSEWDGNVASRILYKLCGALLYSQGKIERSTDF